MCVNLAYPAVTVRVHDNLSDLHLLEAGWKSLFRQHGGWNVFLSWQWFYSWWSSFGSGNQLRVLAASHRARLVGVAPLMVETREDGRPQLSLMGSDHTTDYGDLLFDPEFVEPLCEAVADLVGDGMAGWEQAELRGLRSSSPLLGPFRHAAHRQGLRTRLETSGTCPRARLAPSWDEQLASLGKKDRHELRRKIRRARSCGDPTLLFLDRPDEVADALEVFFRLHRASNREKATFLDDGMESFFTRVFLAFVAEGWLRLNLMGIDGRDVAASVSFSRESGVMLYNSGLDPEYRPHSVGIALHAAEIQQAINQGKEWYDFLRGNEPYKYGFGAQDSPIHTLTVLPGGSS